MIECQKCESTEMHCTQYCDDIGRIEESSYTCRNCGHYVGTMSYGDWFENEDDLEETA